MQHICNTQHCHYLHHIDNAEPGCFRVQRLGFACPGDDAGRGRRCDDANGAGHRRRPAAIGSGCKALRQCSIASDDGALHRGTVAAWHVHDLGGGRRNRGRQRDAARDPARACRRRPCERARALALPSLGARNPLVDGYKTGARMQDKTHFYRTSYHQRWRCSRCAGSRESGNQRWCAARRPCGDESRVSSRAHARLPRRRERGHPWQATRRARNPAAVRNGEAGR